MYLLYALQTIILTAFNILTHIYLELSLISQTFLGAAAGSLGLAVTASLGGSDVPIKLPSAPQISLGSSSGSSKPAASAPVSKLSFTKAPKGEFSFSLNHLDMRILVVIFDYGRNLMSL